MLDDEQRIRLGQLQQRELDGVLDPAEQTELDLLVDCVTSDEQRYLPAATESIRAERVQLQAQNKALKSVLRRQNRLAKRLEQVIATSKLEREAIQAELTQALTLTGAEPAHH